MFSFLCVHSIVFPSSSLLVMTSAVVLVKSVLGFLPPAAVVPIPGQSSMRHCNHQRESEYAKHVCAPMVHDHSLHQHGEGTGSLPTPKHASTINSASHNEIAQPHLVPDIRSCRAVDQNWEWWTLIGRVYRLVACFHP